MPLDSSHSPDAHRDPPLVVQGVNVLLVVGAVIWAVGVFTTTRHLLEAIDAGEAPDALLRDASAAAQRLVFSIAALAAFVAIFCFPLSLHWFTGSAPRMAI